MLPPIVTKEKMPECHCFLRLCNVCNLCSPAPIVQHVGRMGRLHARDQICTFHEIRFGNLEEILPIHFN